MSNEELKKVLDKIEDQKLIDYLLTYRAITTPAVLSELLDYLGVKLNKEAIGGFVPKFEIEHFEIGDRIYLGGVFIQGQFFEIHFIAYTDGECYISMYKEDDIILYHQKASD